MNMTNPETDETYITVKEAAERLGVDRSALVRMLKSGKRGLQGKQVKVDLQPRPVWMVLESSLESFKRGIGGRPRKK
jgi:predicted DNA-binding transcriptional regulator AlpA